MTSRTPITHYAITLVILLALFALATWAVGHFFPRYYIGYLVGAALTLYLVIRESRRTPNNMKRFLEANLEYFNPDFIKEEDLADVDSPN